MGFKIQAEINSNLKRYVMSFSFKERRARELVKYRQRVSELENMEPDEIDFEYINLKTEYENKKSVLNIFVISILLAVLMNVWKYFFRLIEKALQYAVEIAKVSFSIAAIIAVFITSFIVSILIINMKEIYRLQKELMIVETVKNIQLEE